MRKLFYCFALVLFLTGCADHARNFTQATGAYTGILPAADDSGIAMTLNVRSGSYALSSKFINKQGKATVTTGGIVQVRKNVVRIGSQEYRVVSDSELRLLDIQGRDIKSKHNYSLRKI